MRAQHRELLEKIAGGDWSEETQDGVREAVESYAKDFGYDLDEEGQPLEEAQAA
jgi:F-type H+-transporting ATPase subunit alpha